jgi:phenylacetic acid degradation operon negative regulatory protein
MKKIGMVKRLSWKVVGRNAGRGLLEMLDTWGDWACSGGRSIYRHTSYPSQGAYWAAVSRLARQGLIARRRTGGRTPVISLTDAGRSRLAANPESKWKRKWDGIWYLLSYDVPERDRSYRNVLRDFLKQHRLGRLHHSAWVTPWDIRPEYHDLCEAASVGSFAVLLHAQVAFGTDDAEIVRKAWPWTQIERSQIAYLENHGKLLAAAKSGQLRGTALQKLPYEELSDYSAAMGLDPLLPRSLWPDTYRGPEVHAFHAAFVKELQRLL